jgi:hypothetical protein
MLEGGRECSELRHRLPLERVEHPLAPAVRLGNLRVRQNVESGELNPLVILFRVV